MIGRVRVRRGRPARGRRAGKEGEDGLHGAGVLDGDVDEQPAASTGAELKAGPKPRHHRLGAHILHSPWHPKSPFHFAGSLIGLVTTVLYMV